MAIKRQQASRIAVFIILINILLVVFSATALANVKRQNAASSILSQAATFEPTKSPTFARPTGRSTSIVSQARSPSSPVTIIGQTQLDANTVALYHFDSQNGNLTLDAGGNYTGTLNGQAFITTTGQYGGSLQLDGNGSYVRTGWLGAMPQGTVELFIDFRSFCATSGNSVDNHTPILYAGGEYGSNDPVMILRVDTALIFQIKTLSGWKYATSGINPCRYLVDATNAGAPVPRWPYDAWRYHHVAATWGSRGMEIWVDGILHGVGADAAYPTTPGLYPIIYACNPQTQVASFNYPLCPIPILYPTATLPPGDNTGGLLPYSTFLIGCDGSFFCGKGEMDEVRISNIQRIFSAAVDPTSTPTPTQTPDVVGSEYTVDVYTTQLYHLNSFVPANNLLEEKSGQYSAHLQGNAAITSGGRFNSGMALDGSSSYANLNFLQNHAQGVIESWVKLSSALSAQILHAGGGYHTNWSQVRLGVDTSQSNTLRFGIKDASSQWNWAVSSVNPTAMVGSWHHVAGTWGPRGLEIWIDGQLCGTNAGFIGQSPDSSDYYWAGCDTNNCMQGMLDEIRFSNIQRSFTLSSGLFAPQTPAPANTPSAYQMYFPMVFGNTGIIPVICGVAGNSPSSIRSIP